MARLVAHVGRRKNAGQPYAGDGAVRIVVLRRRCIDPSRGACGGDPDEVAQWERANSADWFSIPLYLYDHSGTVYRVGQTNPFHCPWDSGRVGIVALRRSEWGDGFLTDARLTACAETVADTYTAWANGECYGYFLRDAEGNELDSCSGFIGRDAVAAEATASARACVASAASRRV